MPIIDVRSPSEYIKGHASGAISIPLFSDEQRAEIGTIYKKKGSKKAIRLGLEYVGPRMHKIVDKVDKLRKNSDIEIYCWRGGMRSQSVEWLLKTAGHKVNRWKGGYKAYRNRVLELWGQQRPYLVLSGLTGCAKTEILREMLLLGSSIIDLEGNANHKGSAFGHIGELSQPTVEQFENDTSIELNNLNNVKRIWIEDESRSIGRIWLQNSFFDIKKRSPIVLIERNREERISHLVSLYGKADPNQLEVGFYQIAKRLGHQNAKKAAEFVSSGKLDLAADIALHYYDKTYNESIRKKENQVLFKIDITGCSHKEAAIKIIEETKKHE